MEKLIKSYDDININILTRTSGRPKGFYRCYLSVKEQTYQKTRHIVSFENEDDLSYLKALDIDLLKVSVSKNQSSIKSTNISGDIYAPYNLYCNEMLSAVSDGWILFLDDDDNLLHNKVIEEIVDQIRINKSEDILYVWQMRYPNGKVLPTDQMVFNKVIKKNCIGSPCFLFHSKYKNNAKWDSYKASDFRFLKQLTDIIPEKLFLKKIGIQINNMGDFGNKNDIEIRALDENTLPNIFYKKWYWRFLPKYHATVFGVLIFQPNTYTFNSKKVKKIIKKSLNRFRS